MRGTRGLWTATAVLLVVVGVVVAGCGGGGGGSTSSNTKGGTINVAIVDNPQMKDIAKLTPSLFTDKTGIKVNYTVLDEGTLRQVTTRDVAAGGGPVDVGLVGPYEAPPVGKEGAPPDPQPQAESGSAGNP